MKKILFILLTIFMLPALGMLELSQDDFDMQILAAAKNGEWAKFHQFIDHVGADEESFNATARRLFTIYSMVKEYKLYREAYLWRNESFNAFKNNLANQCSALINKQQEYNAPIEALLCLRRLKQNGNMAGALLYTNFIDLLAPYFEHISLRSYIPLDRWLSISHHDGHYQGLRLCDRLAIDCLVPSGQLATFQGRMGHLYKKITQTCSDNLPGVRHPEARDAMIIFGFLLTYSVLHAFLAHYFSLGYSQYSSL